MKEYPTVYVVISEDGVINAVYYEKQSAVDFCQRCMAEQMLDARDWECYFDIQTVKVSR